MSVTALVTQYAYDEKLMEHHEKNGKEINMHSKRKKKEMEVSVCTQFAFYDAKKEMTKQTERKFNRNSESINLLRQKSERMKNGKPERSLSHF